MLKMKIVDYTASVVIILFAVFLERQAYMAANDENLFFYAAFFFYLGSVVLYSYFKPKILAVFRAITWVCKWLSFPESRHMAIVYSAVFFVGGGWFFYQWLFAD